MSKDPSKAIAASLEEVLQPVGEAEEACEDAVIRIPTAAGDVRVARGEARRVDLGFLTTELLFAGEDEDGEDTDDEDTALNDEPFDVVVVTRTRAPGRQMHVHFYRRHEVVNMSRFEEAR